MTVDSTLAERCVAPVAASVLLSLASPSDAQPLASTGTKARRRKPLNPVRDRCHHERYGAVRRSVRSHRVFDNDGTLCEIVARLCVFRAVPWESFWMAPEVEGNAGVTRSLLRAATAKAQEWAPHWFYANADNDEMCKTLERLGGQWLPMHSFLLPLEGEACRATY